MDTTELFLKLVKDFAKDGTITDMEKSILFKKAKELGIDESSLDTIIEMELSNSMNASANTVVQNEEKQKLSLRKTHNGTWWQKTGIEGYDFGIMADDSDESFYFFKCLDKNKVKIKIEGLGNDDTEIITEMELIEFKDGIFNITTKDILFILKPVDDLDSKAFALHAKRLQEEMINYFNKFIEENLKFKIRKEEEEIENTKKESNEKENEEIESKKEKTKTYRWEAFNLSDSTIDVKDGTITILTDEDSNHAVVFLCSDIADGKIKEGRKEHDEWKFELLEKDTKIELIEFMPSKINIKTSNSLYTFMHHELGGVEFRESCKKYFPADIIIDDPNLLLKLQQWQEGIKKRNDEMQELNARELQRYDEKIEREKAEREQEEKNSYLNNFTKDDSINVSPDSVNAKSEFSSSVTRGGDVINPDKIIINNGTVTWKKRSKILIGGESVTIPIDKVSSVDLKGGVIGTDIIIRSTGRGSIHAENFTKSDAQKIKSMLGY